MMISRHIFVLIMVQITVIFMMVSIVILGRFSGKIAKKYIGKLRISKEKNGFGKDTVKEP